MLLFPTLPQPADLVRMRLEVEAAEVVREACSEVVEAADPDRLVDRAGPSLALGPATGPLVLPTRGPPLPLLQRRTRGHDQRGEVKDYRRHSGVLAVRSGLDVLYIDHYNYPFIPPSYSILPFPAIMAYGEKFVQGKSITRAALHCL